ncbi:MULTISPECIES: HAMP domain-containing sensor histidine kinase [unclassified Clostridium]|uniref:sensor histidine kinase n=1 Tax=unclassified Clostridium TaxID=2614128 RepID=UPI0002981F77|nr:MULTISPECIES: HAMP domain-containing sensor histidine kinase [unclassified Clostridium]EKQ53627.1 MAG: signal transduction histidine kinase [Clostridium sp. Maddingley MBC34-26]
MKNKIIRSLSSLNIKFILMNVLGVLIIVCGIYGIMSFYNTNTTEGKINNLNSAFVKAQEYVNRNDKSCGEYLENVAELYNVNAAVIDKDGKIILKSKNVKEDKLDTEKINKWFHKEYADGNFYQMYYITIDNKTEKLLMWDKEPIYYNDRTMVYIFMMPVIIAMLLTFLLINRKVKYIKQIAEGAGEFSNGNLDYIIRKKGKDELGFLAQSMNDMARKLKENIEKERAQEKFKTELITNVSHDLRTPLTSLIAYLQLVENEKTTEENKKKYTKISIEKAYRLKQLIEDLFEYSKLECGGIALEKEEVNIIEILEQSIGELFIEAQKRNMNLKKKFKNSKVILKVDSGKLGRVFENLLSNAVKYGVEGTEVYVNLKEYNEYVAITFENEIASESLDDTLNLFDRFYRGDKSRNSKVSGSGLGLAISKNIVELHKGEIWAECENNIFKIHVKIYKNWKKGF